MSKVSFTAVAVTAAIDNQGRLAAVCACEKAVDKEEFIRFMRLLRSRVFG